MVFESVDQKLPLVVIAGPTASGKTALAITLAQQFGGEIICADSRTIYKDMDIGTAKPSVEEQAGVPHWGLNIVAPGEAFSAADFKRYAVAKIAEIRARGRVPFLVGGTGLYIDAVVFDFAFGTQADEAMRRKFEAMTLSDLHNYCTKNNIILPENSQNKRYVIRAIEQKSISTSRNTAPIPHTLIVGIATERHMLRTRIEHRAEQLFANGVVEEAKMLGEKYGWESEAMTGNIYPLVQQYLAGELSKPELEAQNSIRDWRLAKRQLTWFRRNPHLLWATLEGAEHYLLQKLAPLARM